MKSLRARSTGLLVALALAALAIISSTPDEVNAQAACGPYREITFYAEPAKINVVSYCTYYCNNYIPESCTGPQTYYYTITYQVQCFACAG